MDKTTLEDIERLLKTLHWGSIEIQVQDGEIVQISKREIFKIERTKKKVHTEGL